MNTFRKILSLIIFTAMVALAAYSQKAVGSDHQPKKEPKPKPADWPVVPNRELKPAAAKATPALDADHEKRPAPASTPATGTK